MRKLYVPLGVFAAWLAVAILASLLPAPSLEAQSPGNARVFGNLPTGVWAPVTRTLAGQLNVSRAPDTRVICSLTTTATASTTVTGCEAPAAGLSIYLTDISIYGGVANAITAASTIQDGTGGACAAAVTVRYYCQHGATSGCEAHFSTPIKADVISELCVLDAAVGTKFVTLTGYIAP